MTDIPDDFIPPAVLAGTREDQRKWLADMVAGCVDSFIYLDEDPDAFRASDFPCRMQDLVCQRTFLSRSERSKHEKDVHDMDMTPPERDHKKEHTEARMSFGFFLLNMLDAVKEGDGERLMRLYVMALKFYRAFGHTQYAYSTFLLTVQLQATLSPRMAHSLTWNRFWNNRGGTGKNIPLDLHLEHLNNFLKSFLKGLGPNLTERSASRISQSIGVLKQMMDKTDRELELSTPSGIHRAARESDDILALVKVFREAELFQCQVGRQFSAFPNFSRDLFRTVSYADYCKWMKNKLREWRKTPI